MRSITIQPALRGSSESAIWVRRVRQMPPGAIVGSMSQLLHRAARAVWRRTPARVRQGAADAVIGRIRPRLPQASRELIRDRAVPRIVIGLLSSPSGLGQSARLAARALAQDGYRVIGHDLCRYFHEVAGNIAHGIPDAGAFRGPAHALLVIGAPYAPFALASLGRDFLKDKLVTG